MSEQDAKNAGNADAADGCTEETEDVVSTELTDKELDSLAGGGVPDDSFATVTGTIEGA